MLEVVSAVILRKDRGVPRILLTQRRASDDFAFAWESPGGKVKSDETRLAALWRELWEELGIKDVDPVTPPLWQGIVTTPKTPLHITFYFVRSYSNEPRPLEGQGLAWWTAEEFVALSVLPGNEAARSAIMPLFYERKRS